MRPHHLVTAVLLVLVASCSGPQKNRIKYGKTTLNELKAEKGEPESIQPKMANSKDEVLIYPENQKYQIKDNVVVTSFRNPISDERLLLYWHHQFEKCETSFKKLESKTASHSEVEYILDCEKQGLSVIYDQKTDVVTRVVEYAQAN